MLDIRQRSQMVRLIDDARVYPSTFACIRLGDKTRVNLKLARFLRQVSSDWQVPQWFWTNCSANTLFYRPCPLGHFSIRTSTLCKLPF